MSLNGGPIRNCCNNRGPESTQAVDAPPTEDWLLKFAHR